MLTHAFSQQKGAVRYNFLHWRQQCCLNTLRCSGVPRRFSHIPLRCSPPRGPCQEMSQLQRATDYRLMPTMRAGLTFDSHFANNSRVTPFKKAVAGSPRPGLFSPKPPLKLTNRNRTFRKHASAFTPERNGWRFDLFDASVSDQRETPTQSRFATAAGAA